MFSLSVESKNAFDSWITEIETAGVPSYLTRTKTENHIMMKMDSLYVFSPTLMDINSICFIITIRDHDKNQYTVALEKLRPEKVASS